MSEQRKLQEVRLSDDEILALLEAGAQKTAAFRQLMTYYHCAMMEIETKFKVLDHAFSLQHDRSPITSIKTRIKSLQSIGEKLHRRHHSITLQAIEESIHDVAGVRVVCSFPEDVYLLADALLAQDDVTLVARKDYIANPKPNGYRSLHLIVAVPIFLAHEKHVMKVEIQLRTIAMDFWAELEHQLRYKKDVVFTEDMARELSECAETSAALDQRMEALRRQVFGSTTYSISETENHKSS